MYRFVSTPHSPRRPRLEVERLEARDCPAAPSISIGVAQLSNHRIRVTGTVTDEHPDNITVNLGGVVSANANPLLNGTFFWEGDASALGTVTASCTDDENLASNVAEAELTNSSPAVTLSISYTGGKMVSLTGQLTDETASGRTITLAGKVSTTVVTASDGTFMWSGEASGLGTITATTTDPWGAASNTAQVVVAADAPAINTFDATEEPGPLREWIFSGYVTGPNVTGLTVRFGGLTSLANKTTNVLSNGYFSMLVVLSEGEEGTATAQTTDVWGQDSNLAEAIVRQTP